MKRGIILTLLLFTLFTAYAQNKDTYTWLSGVSIGFLPVNVSGTQNVGDNGSTPIYRYVDTSAVMINLVAHVGASVPFYANESWSTGAKLSIGFGYQNNRGAAQGLSAFLLNTRSYAYYRNYSSSFDFSILLGHQFTFTALNSHLMILGFEFGVGEDASLRLYSSLFRYKYYREYTNGILEPALRIGEFGVSYIFNF